MAVDGRRARLDGNGAASAGIPATMGSRVVALDKGGRVTAIGANSFKYYRMGHALKGAQDGFGNTDTFVYDALGRPTQYHQQLTASERLDTDEYYIYAGTGDGVAAIVSSDHYPAAPPNQYREEPVLPKTHYLFVYEGSDQPIAYFENGKLNYYELDTLNNVRRLHSAPTDTVPAGDKGGYSYTAFGELIGSNPDAGPQDEEQPLRWQGRRQLRNGLYDFRARVWSPALGAFLQPDEFQFVTSRGTLGSWPGQNPFRWRDPSGRYAGLPPPPVAIASESWAFGPLAGAFAAAGLGGYAFGYLALGPKIFQRKMNP